MRCSAICRTFSHANSTDSRSTWYTFMLDGQKRCGFKGFYTWTCFLLQLLLSRSRSYGISSIVIVIYTLESVGELLRCWTQVLGVWVSNPAVMYKSLGHALNPHSLCPPSSNGYQVERKLVLCEWLQLQKIALHSPQGDETESLGSNTWGWIM